MKDQIFFATLTAEPYDFIESPTLDDFAFAGVDTPNPGLAIVDFILCHSSPDPDFPYVNANGQFFPQDELLKTADNGSIIYKTLEDQAIPLNHVENQVVGFVKKAIFKELGKDPGPIYCRGIIFKDRFPNVIQAVTENRAAFSMEVRYKRPVYLWDGKSFEWGDNPQIQLYRGRFYQGKYVSQAIRDIVGFTGASILVGEKPADKNACVLRAIASQDPMLSMFPDKNAKEKGGDIKMTDKEIIEMALESMDEAAIPPEVVELVKKLHKEKPDVKMGEIIKEAWDIYKKSQTAPAKLSDEEQKKLDEQKQCVSEEAAKKSAEELKKIEEQKKLDEQKKLADEEAAKCKKQKAEEEAAKKSAEELKKIEEEKKKKEEEMALKNKYGEKYGKKYGYPKSYPAPKGKAEVEADAELATIVDEVFGTTIEMVEKAFAEELSKKDVEIAELKKISAEYASHKEADAKLEAEAKIVEKAKARIQELSALKLSEKQMELIEDKAKTMSDEDWKKEIELLLSFESKANYIPIGDSTGDVNKYDNLWKK